MESTDSVDAAEGPGTPVDRDLFRREALGYHLAEDEEGDVLRLPAAWTRWTYRLLLAVVLAGVVYLVVGTVPVYESGPALLQVEGRTTLYSELSGTVDSVNVAPGQAVRAGDELLRFRDDRERADLAKIDREFERHLVNRLREPGNDLAGRELTRLGAERDRVVARLEARSVRAESFGIVSDVRIRPGQYLEAGEPVVSLFPEDPGYRVVTLLPGHARPQIDPQMQLRLEIAGFPYAFTTATIRRVGDQVIGPAEARRFLGPENADSIPVDGPVVLVIADLDAETFHSGERDYRVHDGMLARAEVRVRTERLIFRLVPGLRALRRNDGA